jgi:hypothetical protein
MKDDFFWILGNTLTKTGLKALANFEAPEMIKSSIKPHRKKPNTSMAILNQQSTFTGRQSIRFLHATVILRFYF